MEFIKKETRKKSEILYRVMEQADPSPNESPLKLDSGRKEKTAL